MEGKTVTPVAELVQYQMRYLAVVGLDSPQRSEPATFQ